MNSWFFFLRLEDPENLVSLLLKAIECFLEEEFKKDHPKPKKDFPNLYLNPQFNCLGKKNSKRLSLLSGSWITLTEDEIKDIIKVISSFKNRVKILKCATEKMISKEEGLLKFLVELMEVALPLIKHVLKPLSKSVLVLFG